MNHVEKACYLFQVSEVSDWLIFKFDYERPHTWQSLVLRDAQGKIRLTHLDCYNEKCVVIHRDPSFSSYLTVPGFIPAGKWKIEFASEDLSEKFSFNYEIITGNGALPSDIQVSSGERYYWANTTSDCHQYELNNYDWQRTLEHSARWYKGDFHTHTVLSDGKMTPERNMEQSEVMGLDFFVATDHNLLSTTWPKGKALVIPGIEFTSHYGHWNALGLRQWVDWRQCSSDGGINTPHGMNRVLAEAGVNGALRSINHPMLVPWAWMFEDTLLNSFEALEIWNDPNYHSNPEATEKALILWNTLWNEGYHITGIGGSDSHMLPDESYGEGNMPSVIGDPATFVYAEHLSAEAILTGVRKGRVYVSRGPVLDIQVSVEGKRFHLGGDLTEAVDSSTNGEVMVGITLSNCAEGVVRVIENGVETEANPVTNGRFHYSASWKGKSYTWVRFEIHSHSGELLAFTNPVYYGNKKKEITTWKQMLEKSSFEVPVN